ncbi:FAD-binding oxidoreductase [Algirhabdus cladophorae]|uniref:FAD-binding oxidoreductase n=1 Tax=Algirhabdus cladophorae TaxID=3377108 RepID=UPI003B846B9B
MLDALREILGPNAVLSGDDTVKWRSDWTDSYHCTPLAVVRPKTTHDVSAVVQWANGTGTPIVPVGGNTGLSGGTFADGAVMISLDRLNQIEEVRPQSRVAIVGAGVILSNLHEAVDAHDLVFPLTFGAKGSAMIGGILSTNAGGSNVVRYGNTRDLCLGIEAVLPTGEIINLMSELHKDNSGLNLKHLLIGAEGTLGLITRAVLKLHPKPRAFATAMLAAKDLDAGLDVLNALQQATGGAVEAFEYMPRAYIDAHRAMFPAAPAPFADSYDVNILAEVGALAPRDARMMQDGSTPVVTHLEDTLAGFIENGLILDAVVAQNEGQRRAMWERREQAAEVVLTQGPVIQNDVALPLDRLQEFLTKASQVLATIDPEAHDISVAHVGDGNIHYTVSPSDTDPAHKDKIVEAIEKLVQDMRGSFSAEHGIGLSKRNSMKRRKDPIALNTMKAIKEALDPNGILNPGKVYPD